MTLSFNTLRVPPSAATLEKVPLTRSPELTENQILGRRMTTIISETQTFSLISPPCGGDLHNETDIYETDLMNPTYIPVQILQVYFDIFICAG